MGKYRTEAARFLAGRKTWYFTYTERGYLLAVGDEFTVFVDDETGKARFFPDMGEYHFLRKERLCAQLEKLGVLSNPRFRKAPTAPEPKPS